MEDNMEKGGEGKIGKKGKAANLRWVGGTRSELWFSRLLVPLPRLALSGPIGPGSACRDEWHFLRITRHGECRRHLNDGFAESKGPLR